MLEFTERALKHGATIQIKQENDTLQATGYSGQQSFELSRKELMPLSYLNSIKAELENGSLLQIHQYGPQIIAAIGKPTTINDIPKFKVFDEERGFDYFDTLVELNVTLARQAQGKEKRVIQYQKIYNGGNKNE